MYRPKVVKGNLKSDVLTDERLKKMITSEDDNELEALRQFYKYLEGIEFYLSLWDYDKHESYHMHTWDMKDDEKFMNAIFHMEKFMGGYSDFEEFKEIWKLGEYEPDGVLCFDLDIIEVLEVICEEVEG